jgi:hypothetical protein
MFFYSPIRKSEPTTILVGSPLFPYREIGLCNSVNPKVERWFHESPKSDNSQRWLFTPSYWDFPYRDFSTHDVEKLGSLTPESLYAETPMRSWVDFSTVHLIANSGFTVSRFLMRCFWHFTLWNSETRATCPLLWLLWPTLSPWLSEYRVSRFRDSCCYVHGSSTYETPIHDSMCRSYDPYGSDQWSYPSWAVNLSRILAVSSLLLLRSNSTRDFANSPQRIPIIWTRPPVV